MKGKCETCKFDNMCAREEVRMSAFDITFNKDKTKVISCKLYQKGEKYD